MNFVKNTPEVSREFLRKFPQKFSVKYSKSSSGNFPEVPRKSLQEFLQELAVNFWKISTDFLQEFPKNFLRSHPDKSKFYPGIPFEIIMGFLLRFTQWTFFIPENSIRSPRELFQKFSSNSSRSFLANSSGNSHRISPRVSWVFFFRGSPWITSTVSRGFLLKCTRNSTNFWSSPGISSRFPRECSQEP